MRYESENIASNIERKKKINKVLSIFVTILLVLMVFVSLFLISLELGNSKELPSFLNMDLYIVTSTSMQPKLNIDDVIIVKKGFDSKSYKAGNIITYYRSDGEIITHRIEKVLASGEYREFITKGDNNETEDDVHVEYDKIIGKVIYIMPKFGKIVRLLKNKIFFTFAFIVLFAVLIYNTRVMNRKKERSELRKEYEEERM